MSIPIVLLSSLIARLRRSEDFLDDAHLLARCSDVGSLSDDDILAIAESHISRVDVFETDLHRVKAALVRLRAAARPARPANSVPVAGPALRAG